MIAPRMHYASRADAYSTACGLVLARHTGLRYVVGADNVPFVSCLRCWHAQDVWEIRYRRDITERPK